MKHSHLLIFSTILATTSSLSYYVGNCEQPGFFHCSNGLCIQSAWLCDGDNDCLTNEDEEKSRCGERTCAEDQMSCNSTGRCIPLRWKCDDEDDCGDGSDEIEEECKAVNKKCPSTKFACSPTECISMDWVCDGDTDCQRGQDELDCNVRCDENINFKCSSGKCIQKEFICDGDRDCPDGSDEKNCTCPQESFDCGDHQCISKRWRCDGDYDCINQSDEKNCSYYYSTTPRITNNCKRDEFACSDQITCIEQAWVCNGHSECPDGGDEHFEICRNASCSFDEFKCKNNQCISGINQCNGFQDCSDYSDEENCDMPKPICARDEFDCGDSNCIPLTQVCNGLANCPEGEDEISGKCGVNECEHNNGGCSQSCIDLPIGFRCACKHGFRRVNETMCEDIDECEDPSSCSQICVNEKGTFKCECKDGYVKEPNKHRFCKASRFNISLVISRRHDIREISLRDTSMRVITNNTKSAIALDLDINLGLVFWSDGLEKIIFKTNFTGNGSSIPIIRRDLILSDGLAVDWIYKHIYWTNNDVDSISLSDYNGEMVKTLISDKLDKPRAITLNPLDGWMFWSDWGTQPRIERAGMDGSHRSTIVSRDIEWPNGVTLDLDQGRLYWIDARLDIISSVNYDGSKRRTVLKGSSAVNHPFSIAVFEDYVYWTDWLNYAVYRTNKLDGKNSEKKVVENIPSLMVVHVNHPYKQPKGTNYCLKTKCSHLCLPAPQINSLSPKSRCECPDDTQSSGLRCLKHPIEPNKDFPKADTPHKSINHTTSTPPTNSTHFLHNVSPFRPEDAKPSKLPYKKNITNYMQIKRESSKTEIALGVFGILVFLTLASLLVYYVYNHYNGNNRGNVSFVNPMYRRAMEEEVTLTKDDYNQQNQSPNPDRMHDAANSNPNNYENFL